MLAKPTRVELPSLFSWSTIFQHWISFVDQRKSTTKFYIRTADNPQMLDVSGTKSGINLSSCPPTPHLHRHSYFEVTIIFHAIDMRDVFPAVHNRSVPPRPLPLHTHSELKYLWELMGRMSDVFMSLDALHCLCVTLRLRGFKRSIGG